jgi:hypothetical protein
MRASTIGSAVIALACATIFGCGAAGRHPKPATGTSGGGAPGGGSDGGAAVDAGAGAGAAGTPGGGTGRAAADGSALGGAGGSAGAVGSGGAGGLSSGGSGGAAGASSGATYEAEDAFLTGAAAIATTPAGFSGAGFVGGLVAAGDGVLFAVHVASAGPVTCRLRYLNPNGGAQALAVSVNGERVGVSTLPASAAFAAHDDTLPLRAGLNTIAYVDEATSVMPLALDALVVLADGALALRGATMPYVAYEAEDGKTNGTVIGPDRTYGTVAAEASQRKAVKLEADGAYVEQTLAASANAIVVRYSMPDAPAGGGVSGALGVYVDGQKRATLALSSKYAWVYGGYPYGNDPNQGSPHHYFDDARALLGDDVPAGATLRLQKEAGDAVASYTIDLEELEEVPAPYASPAGALSIESYGATKGDATDDTAAIRAAIAAAKAQGKEVWIPAGDYTLASRIDLATVTIRGAGPWYSVLHGLSGKGGFNSTGAATRLLDFALYGDVSYRDDANFDAGMDGTLGAGSLLQNLWFEHTKVGIWTIGGDTALVVGCRIRDTFADGINFTNGTRRSMIEQVAIRNTGDDGIALWSTNQPDARNVVRHASVALPMLANGIALYGGTDNRVLDSLVADTVVAAAGIAVSTRAEFNPLPFTGSTEVARATLTRTGGYEFNWMTSFGGLWIFADASALPPGLVVRDVVIRDSTYQGVLVSGTKPVDGALFERVTVQGATAAGIQIASPGTGTFNAVTVSGAATGSNVVQGFTATKDAASTGW